MTFLPFGPLSGLTYGNGLTLSRGYDRNYWLSGITLTDGSTPLLSLSLSRDQNGNLASITDNAGTGRDAVFGYSGAERLSLSLGAWSTTGDQGAELGTISSTSNRALIYRAESGPVANDPNLAIGTTFTYNYNARERLANLVKDGLSIASYEYDHAGLRVSATRSGSSPATVHYVYDPSGHLLAEHDGSTGALIREYVWLDDMPLALIAGSVSAPGYYFVHTGQIDEPLIVTDASKAKVWDAVIDPWGRATLLSTPTQPLNLRLPGQWYAAESSLHQNWMREYDPALGRYIEADPLGIDAGSNPYAYVQSNPLNLSDPMGLQVVVPVPGRVPVPGYPASGTDRNHNGLDDAGEAAAGQLGRGLGALGDWLCAHSWLCQKYNPKPEPIPSPVPDTAVCPTDGDDDPQCHRASKWELKQAGIYDEHEYKIEHGARPPSRYDICKCKDGSIRIAPVGECGTTRYFWF